MIFKEVTSVFRPSRWYRNSFMILGAVLAIGITEQTLQDNLSNIVIAFISLSLMASGNYGINEILDVETDRRHPQKRFRSLASGKVSIRLILLLSIVFYMLSIFIIVSLDKSPLTVSMFLLLISGFFYNVKPFRVKDIPYADFLFEALNNPIRLAVGWYSVVDTNEMPLSFVLGFYAIGVFLMASKSFGELRLFDGLDTKASEYRASLLHYTEKNLLFSMIASISTFSFLFGILSYKYNINLIMMLPLFIVWVVWFFQIAYEDNSIVKDPERIFEKKPFLIFSFSLVVLFVVLLFSDANIMSFLMRPVTGY